MRNRDVCENCGLLRAESATSTTFDVAMPSHRRELQTTVSNTAELQSALANTAVGHIVLSPGSYLLNAQLSITRSIVLEAAVGGSVVLNAQASSSSPRRVLLIDPGSSGVVQLIRLSITGGHAEGVIGWNGGGVHVASGTLTLASCSIYGNTAYSWGGGVRRGGQHSHTEQLSNLLQRRCRKRSWHSGRWRLRERKHSLIDQLSDQLQYRNQWGQSLY